jgi:hypothetical protein
MKKNILLFVLVSHFSIALCLPSYEKQILVVEKYVLIGNVYSLFSLKFKPGKRLTLITSEGRKLTSKDYSLHDTSIVMKFADDAGIFTSDTILLQDISLIKGRVYGNFTRKIAGVLITVSGLALGFFTMAYGHGTGGPWLLVEVPLAGITAAGLSLGGARRFNTPEKWRLKIIRQ